MTAQIPAPNARNANATMSMFDITSGEGIAAIPVHANRGAIKFTIKNRTDEELQTRFEIRVAAPAPAGFKPEWLQVDRAVRRVPAQGNDDVLVTLNAPPAVQGDFSFQLFAVPLPAKDERFTAGPSIGVSLRAEGPPPPKPNWWIFVVAAIALLIIGGAVYYFARPATAPPPSNFVTVPSVIGLTPADASRKLQNAGLVAGDLKNVSVSLVREVPPGTIADQNPGDGKTVGRGTRVSLFVFLSR